MAAKKFYAVKKGLTPGIYTNWPDCQAQINGYSGAVYKGFATLEEAKEFMGGKAEIFGEAEQMTLPFLQQAPVAEKEMVAADGTEAVAYVDGSYDVTTGSFSYGMVFFQDGKEEHFSKKFEGSDLASMRNVAGEIMGAERAFAFALEEGAGVLSVYHDYEGIAKWCTGEWQAKKPGTQAYRAQYLDAKAKGLDIQFYKVKGHSGDTYNDMADRLAKDELGIK